MSNGLFRKKSLDKISSPEQINDYIKTSNIPSWIMLAVITAFLLGAFVWGIFGKVNVSIETIAVSSGANAVCYISETDIERITKNSTVSVGQEEYSISEISKQPYLAGKHLSDYEIHMGDFSNDEWLYEITIDGEIKSGIHNASIILEKVSPISLIME